MKTEIKPRPPPPPFTGETARQKVQAAKDAWNTRDPERVALAYTEDAEWRNRSEFLHGRAQVIEFLRRKWNKELDYRLKKELWAFRDNRIAVRFEYDRSVLRVLASQDECRTMSVPKVNGYGNSIKAAGIRLSFLSNFSRRMLEAGIKNSGLDGMFEQLPTTDEVKQFKPAPRAYQMAVDALGLKREAIAFAAFAGWDASGARWFGFPTVWVNRMNSATEESNALPDLTCGDLSIPARTGRASQSR
ncbi:MAG: HAD-IA family hydrolase [Verrucomicrobiales bacterium]|nr:HAD-IA family hydrolase [Verrucomicrobiales bacterium]